MKTSCFFAVLFALSTTAFAALPDLSRLEGEYEGKMPDSQTDCKVSISRAGSDFTFKSETPAWGAKLAFRRVRKAELDRELEKDLADRKKTGKSLDWAEAFFANSNFLFPEDWQQSDNLRLYWYQGELNIVSQISESGGGPFINPGDRVELDCFGLRKVQ